MSTLNTSENQVPSNKIDLSEAERFLKLLDPGTDTFCFQTIDDHRIIKDGREVAAPRFCSEIRTGALADLAPRLAEWNRKGAGVFVCVNRTDGQGRKVENITGVRAVWRELDQEVFASEDLRPSIVVESSPGKSHEYFLVAPDDPLLFDEFDGVQQHLVFFLHSDPNAADRSRVLRLPGFLHNKREPVRTRLIGGTGPCYTRTEILAAFPPIDMPKSGTPSIVSDLAHTPASEALVRSILAWIPGEWIEVRANWLSAGFGIARLGDHWQDDDGYDLRLPHWEELSTKAPGYEHGDTGCEEKWDEILEYACKKKRGATIQSLLWVAMKHGWALEGSGIAPELRQEAQESYHKITGDWQQIDEILALYPSIGESAQPVEADCESLPKAASSVAFELTKALISKRLGRAQSYRFAIPA
jgi:RepB DNA-primase from phage plasmid/Primase C terminal 2 (PriCT-2)